MTQHSQLPVILKHLCQQDISPSISGFPSALILLPAGYLAMSQRQKGGCYWHLVGAEMLLNMPQHLGQSPRQRITLPQMPVMPRLTKPALDETRSILLGSGDSGHKAWPPNVSSIKKKQGTGILGHQPECGTYLFILTVILTKMAFLSFSDPEL